MDNGRQAFRHRNSARVYKIQAQGMVAILGMSRQRYNIYVRGLPRAVGWKLFYVLRSFSHELTCTHVPKAIASLPKR
jgi:hypothetical protein